MPGADRPHQLTRPDFSDVSASRRRNMAAIRSTSTKPEVTLRRALHAMGYRYKLHDRDLPGRPDMVFPARRKIIEVRGCWWHWHGCANSVMPQTRADWWTAKLEGNVARDARNVAALESAGWAILIVWECEVRTDAKAAALKAVDFLGPTGIVVPTAKLGTLRVEKVESGNREHGHQR